MIKRFNFLKIFFFAVLIAVFSISSTVSAEPVKIKVGTIVPKGTAMSVGVLMYQSMFESPSLKSILGDSINFKIYWGAIQGDERQMIQKTKMGQLDMVTITPMGIPLVCTKMEVFMIAYLINDYGEFDYIVNSLKKDINEAYYEKGWIVLNLASTEGPHHLYVNGPYRTPKELRENLVAGTYGGGADDTFYKALGIPQTSVQVSDAFLMFKQGLLSGGLSSPMMSVSLQMYLNQKYVIQPPIRFCPNGFAFSKRRWERLPWEMRALFIVGQPFLLFQGGIFRDSSAAFYDSLKKVGVKEVRLTPKELKVWKDLVIDYRKTYLSDNKDKQVFYDKIMAARKEYRKGGTSEEKIYKNDPDYKDFKETMSELSKAISSYQKTGDSKYLANLEERKIIMDWQLYDWVAASEDYIKTGKADNLKKWMSSFFIAEEVNELFSKHPDVIKKMFGSKKSINAILDAFKKFLDYPGYKAYQK